MRFSALATLSLRSTAAPTCWRTYEAPTSSQIGGALGVAGFGSLYLTLATRPGNAHASHAFALTALALGGVALLASTTAYLATHTGGNVDDPELNPTASDGPHQHSS